MVQLQGIKVTEEEYRQIARYVETVSQYPGHRHDRPGEGTELAFAIHRHSYDMATRRTRKLP